MNRQRFFGWVLILQTVSGPAAGGVVLRSAGGDEPWWWSTPRSSVLPASACQGDCYSGVCEQRMQRGGEIGRHGGVFSSSSSKVFVISSICHQSSIDSPSVCYYNLSHGVSLVGGEGGGAVCTSYCGGTFLCTGCCTPRSPVSTAFTFMGHRKGMVLIFV